LEGETIRPPEVLDQMMTASFEISDVRPAAFDRFVEEAGSTACSASATGMPGHQVEPAASSPSLGRAAASEMRPWLPLSPS